jgi:16S rRNA (adenine1518-N6/adenine1519-N6)-dimethyltransferase
VTLSRADASRQLDGAGLRAKRALGQNFVVDPNTVRRIATLAAVGPGDDVLEIGAGLGSLTIALAETSARVTAVEIDTSLLPLLTENVGHLPGVTVVQGDAMNLDWNALLDGRDGVPGVRRLFVMVQKEVGERLAARPGDDAYGAVSVKVAFHGTARIAGIVPPTVFLPRPNVDSALVAIERHAAPLAPGVDPKVLFRLVRAGFAKRRKMLRGAMAGAATPEQLAAAGIDGTRRAEELSVHDWMGLARVVAGTAG